MGPTNEPIPIIRPHTLPENEMSPRYIFWFASGEPTGQQIWDSVGKQTGEHILFTCEAHAIFEPTQVNGIAMQVL